MNALDCLRIGFQHTVTDRLNVAAYVGQGSAKFVGNVRNHVASLPFGVFKTLCHGIEGARQLANFVTPGHSHPL